MRILFLTKHGNHGEWVEQHLCWLLTRYGYVEIFVALALGIIGLPIPDEVLLTYVGYNIFQGQLYPFALLSAFLGATSGITISYVIGSKLGLPFLKKIGPKIHITSDRLHDVCLSWCIHMELYFSFVGK